MRTSARALVAIVIAVGALVVSSMASAAPPADVAAPSVTQPPNDGAGSPGSPGMACPLEHPDCVDTGFGSGDNTDLPPERPQIVEPRPGMVDVRPTGFDDVSVGDDDRTVTLTFWSGVEPCYVLDHVDVRADADTVTITLFQGSDPNAGDVACIEIAVKKQVTITLDEPLAGRDIVDGAR